jgi:hypothetical protein
MIGEHCEMRLRHRKRFEVRGGYKKIEKCVKEHECPEEGGSEPLLGEVQLGGGSKS